MMFLTGLVIGRESAGEVWPSGLGVEATAAERALAEKPEPDAYFRELTGYWHGVPGLEALRRRWEGFAARGNEKERPDFAVLAALVCEAEGKPEEALEKLHSLTGGDARWNESRLLALLGREEEAVAVLAPLVTSVERPETGAAALIAVTERDCLRGDFAGALKRTEAAWEARPEEAFRMRILERHLSLLVEAGKEREFVEAQVALADQAAAAPGGGEDKPAASGDKPASGNTPKAPAESVTAAPGESAAVALAQKENGAALTARKVLAVMADWFTADPRLRAVREKLLADYTTGVPDGAAERAHGVQWIRPRPTLECGTFWPQERELSRLGEEAESPAVTAGMLASRFAAAGEWPESLDGQPLLKRVFQERPLYLGGQLFANPDPLHPLPALARKLADSLPAGAERQVMDLMERAWAGKAVPADAEILASVITEAPQFRRERAVRPPPEDSTRQGGWPQLPAFPTEQIIWNLSGKSWAVFYRNACRLAPLRNQQNARFYAEKEGVSGWSWWRPEWPDGREVALTVWAWRQLTLLGEATPERAAAVARRIPEVSDRFLFAARCLRRELLVEWCRDSGLLERVSSAGLMQAVIALRHEDSRVPPEEEAAAVLAIGREMARRLGLNEFDLIRSLGDFRQHAPAEMKRDFENRPADALLVEAMGLFLDWEDPVLRELWVQRQPRTIPHPLYGVPVCPSVERFRVLSVLLGQPTGGESRLAPATPLQRVVQVLMGGDMFFESSGRASPLLRALESFATTNPVKRELLRWEVLSGIHRIAAGDQESRARRFAERDEGRQDVNLAKALRELAEEQQADLSWYLVRAVLEENPVKRAVLLDLLRTRGPLPAGVETQAGASASAGDAHAFPAPEAEAGAAGGESGAGQPRFRNPRPEELAALFLKMLADPAVRQRLEPAGMLSVMMRQGPSRDAFVLSVQRNLSAPAGTAELLIKERDPLAARMAVILMTRQGQPEVSAEWVGKALKAFPDDPELLLASVALEAQRGSGEPTEAIRAVFLKGLANLGALMPFDRDTYAVWCGVDAGMPRGGLETARALAAFVERAQPESIPQNWTQVMEGTLSDSAQLRQLTEPEARAMVMAVVRHKTRWRPGDGSPQGWMSLLDALKQADRPELAAEAAELLLSGSRGSLGYPGAPAEPAPPWGDGSGEEATGPGAEGWKWLLLAERDDPAGLADRLRAVASTHPGDEQTAFAALLARGRTRPLTAEDLRILETLPPPGRHRALAYASWLLPPDRLPEARVLDSWEAEARVEFSDAGNGIRNFLQGNAYLDRLENAGAADAARRVLPALVESVKTAGGFPEGYPGLLFRRLHGLDAPPELAARLQTILMDLLKKPPQRYGLQPNELLAAAVDAQFEKSAPAELPEELVRRVTEALEAGTRKSPAGDKNEEQDQDRNQRPVRLQEQDLLSLAYATAGDPRWHGLLRQLLASRTRTEYSGDRAPSWHTLSILLGVMDSGHAIPEIKLGFSPERPGKGKLTWTFEGLMPPPVPEKWRPGGQDKIRLPWRTLAAALAGQFDALVLTVDDDPKGGERLAARIEQLPASGEISLTGLPETGQIRLMLIRRKAPWITAETEPLTCNTMAVILDTASPPGPQTAHPADWRLLCEPCGLSNADEWQIVSSRQASDWPDGIALLLLDDTNQLCATADLQRRDSGNADISAVRIARSQFGGEPVRSGSRTSLRLSGVPCRLALGISIRPPARGSDGLLSSTGSPLPLPRFTVQKYPQAADTVPVTGHMEIIRTWHLPFTPRPESYPLQTNPSIMRSPLRAVWYDGGELFLIDLEKEKAVSRTLKLKIPPGAVPAGIHWTGSRMHLLFQTRPADGAANGLSILYSFDPDTEAPPAKPYDFGKVVEFQSLEPYGIPGVFGIQTDGRLCGILTADGHVLTLNPSSSPEGADRPAPGSPRYAISPTRVGCFTEKEGEYPVLDWTDGTLRFFMAPEREPILPQHRQGIPLLHGEANLLEDSSINPRTYWRSPLKFLNGIEFIGGDQFTGLISDAYGSGRGIVLMRKVPLEKAAAERKP
ncbi:MAG: hypothetical protein V4726_11340 [Verrucomicrobiota bacterium]